MSSKQPSTSAKILYRPVGRSVQLLADCSPGSSSNKCGAERRPTKKSDPPKPLETEYPFKEIILAAAIQGAIFSVVKTVIDRQGARLFEKWTGEWPGS